MGKPAKWILLGLLGLLATWIGCATDSTRESPVVQSNYTTIPWQRSQLANLEVTLLDNKRVEHFSFKEDGTVIMEFGTTKYLIAPIEYWELRGERVVITSDDGTVYDELFLISLSHDILQVKRRDGSIARYKVHHHEPCQSRVCDAELTSNFFCSFLSARNLSFAR